MRRATGVERWRGVYMMIVPMLLLATEVQLYSVPCSDIWRAAVPAWTALGLRTVSIDRPGGTAILGASFTGVEATRRIKQWTTGNMAFYSRLAVDVTLTFDSKTIYGLECCEFRVNPLFQVTWTTATSEGISSMALEKSLIQAITRGATKPVP